MEEIQRILGENYNLHEVALFRLEGYDSTNYKIDALGMRYVFKIYENSIETRDLLQVEQQILVQLQSMANYNFPKNIPTRAGDHYVIVDNVIYRLLSYIEGHFLGEVSHSAELLLNFGRFLGNITALVSGMYAPILASRISSWDIQHFLKNKDLVEYIPNAKDRNLVDYFFLQFEEKVIPLQYTLRKGIIHGDANDWNVLTQADRIKGIIDFGDMCHSWLVNEIAIAMTYAMMGKEDPLESGAIVIGGYQQNFPLLESELQVLYYLVAARLCISVCNSAYTKTIKPKSAYITISEQPAWDLLKKWLRVNPLKASEVFRRAAGYPPLPIPSAEIQLVRRKAYISESLSVSYNRPIAMERSAFQYMYDTEGNTFLDAYNNIMLAGHCHPKVVRAAQSSLAKLNTNTRYLYQELLDYSEKLLSKFPTRLNKVFFVNSGSAASDLAIRLAMAHTTKQKIMVVQHGYHGNTKTGIEISHYKYSQKNGIGKADYVIETPLPNGFNSGFQTEELAASHFMAQTQQHIANHSGELAAFIAEPIVGCGGQVPLAKGYLKGIYKEIQKQGGLCISDEVQVGFGRLGDYFWGFEMHDVVPDMVIIGKPMGNGHPIGAVVTTSKIASSFTNGVEFFSSFGGNPVSCATGNAVLEVIEEEDLQQHAKSVGDFLKSLLQKLQREHSEIADIRGSGLFLGVELMDEKGKPNTALAAQLKNGLREKYILIGTDGPYDSVLKIKPPLSFSMENAQELVDALAEQLKKSNYR